MLKYAGIDERPEYYTKNYMQLRNAEGEEIAFPREKHNDLLDNTKHSALKTYIQLKMYKKSTFYLGIYKHTHT